MKASPRRKGVILIGNNPGAITRVWASGPVEKLHELVDLPVQPVPVDQLEEHKDWLAETVVIFSTWGMPKLTPEQLSFFPKLKVVFYAAGTIKYFAEPLLDRGIIVVSAWAANAVPVAEFTLSQILFGLKMGWQHVRHLRESSEPNKWRELGAPGVYNATVGIISLGMIGQKVCELLDPFQVTRLAYDPVASDETFHRCRARKVTLEELFAQSDMVTLHSPWLKQTEGMITGELLASMKPNSTFINTARGAIVREDEMIDVLRKRSDLMAVLDITYPEPPAADSPLYQLPNVALTPHIAGSIGNEVVRMADLMVEEFAAWNEGRPLRYAVDRELMAKIA